MQAYRVFYAHRQDATPDDAVLLWLYDALQKALPDREVIVVSGIDDFQRNIGRCGGWAGWIKHVGEGRTVTGEPTYHAIVVPDRAVGMATAQIIDAAVKGSRKVLRIMFAAETDPSGKGSAYTPEAFMPVTGTRRLDPSAGGAAYAELI